MHTEKGEENQKGKEKEKLPQCHATPFPRNPKSKNEL